MTDQQILSRHLQCGAAVVSTVAAEHEGLPFDSSSDLLFSVWMLSLWLHRDFSWYSCFFFFFTTVQKRRCTQEECILFKHPALLITATFVWSDTLVYCLFLHYIFIWRLRQKRTMSQAETWQKTKPWSPNITNDKTNCWSQKAEKKDFLKCKNFQSGISAIWPVKSVGDSLFKTRHMCESGKQDTERNVGYSRSSELSQRTARQSAVMSSCVWMNEVFSLMWAIIWASRKEKKQDCGKYSAQIQTWTSFLKSFACKGNKRNNVMQYIKSIQKYCRETKE